MGNWTKYIHKYKELYLYVSMGMFHEFYNKLSFDLNV